MAFLIYILLSYLCGAIPFGYLAGKVNGLDLREHGSRNIGATNAMRVLGKKWGISVFLLDFIKGFLPVFLWKEVFSVDLIDASSSSFGWWFYAGIVLSGLATILGHTYTCFLNFKGGKGVASTCGVLFAISPLIAAISLAGWFVALVITRYVSIASIAASIIMIIAALYDFGYFGAAGWSWRPDTLVVLFLILVSLLVIVKHRGNIQRVVAGVEPKAFTKKSSEKA